MLYCSTNCVAAATAAVDVVSLPCNAQSIYIRLLCKFIHLICCEVVISCASAVAAVAAFTYDIFFLLRCSRVSARSIVFECVVLQQPCAHCLSHTLQVTRNPKHWKQNTLQTRKNCSAAHSTASRHTGHLPFIAFITVSVDKLQSVSEKSSTKKKTNKQKWPREWSTSIFKKNDRLESFDFI